MRNRRQKLISGIIYSGGWGRESNREIVSCRAVRAGVRTRGVVAQVVSQRKRRVPPAFTFPFCPGILSLFPPGNNMREVRSSESK